MVRLIQSKTVAVLWFLLMCILFFLPGSAIPEERGWMALIRIDKLVHMGLFAILFFTWRNAFKFQTKYYSLLLIIACIIFGFLVEIIQKYWIPARTFDMYDVLADSTGVVVGWIVYEVYKKNKPL
jgi:VanZ family protein